MKKAREPLSASLPDLRGAKLTRRVILFLLALAVAVGAFAFGVRGLLSADPGWTVIEADGSGGLSCANEFVLRVDLGAGGRDPGGDRRGAIAAYTRAAARAWQLFTPDSPVEETVNIWWLNAHPNTEVPVEPLLYRGNPVGLLYRLRLRSEPELDSLLSHADLGRYLELTRMRPCSSDPAVYTRAVNRGEGFTPPGLFFGLFYAWYLDNALAPNIEYKMAIMRHAKSAMIPEQWRMSRRRGDTVAFFRDKVFGGDEA